MRIASPSVTTYTTRTGGQLINPRCACAQRGLLQGDKVSQNHHDLRKLADTVGWKKLWDHCLDQGETCVASLVNLVRILSYPQHATRSCPLCESDSELQIVSLADHIISQHTSSSDSWNTLLNSLCELEPKCFTHLLCLYKLFKPS